MGLVRGGWHFAFQIQPNGLDIEKKKRTPCTFISRSSQLHAKDAGSPGLEKAQELDVIGVTWETCLSPYMWLAMRLRLGPA